MATHLNLLLGGLFYSATLFLVACGLQLIFGVQKIVNLTCGSFYALGAYFGITVAGLVLPLGWPPQLVLLALVVGGAAAGLVAIPLERLLRPVYRRDPSYQLLLTFGLLLMFQDVFRFCALALLFRQGHPFIRSFAEDKFVKNIYTFSHC